MIKVKAHAKYLGQKSFNSANCPDT